MLLLRKIKKRGYNFYLAFLIKISPFLASKYLYKKKTDRKLNLKYPKNFNEKIHWLKLYWKHPLVHKCGDKYEVRDYVRQMNCSNILMGLYNVYENVSEIDWDSLPSKFVLKVTSGCGYNIICKDKAKLDKNKAEKQLNKWMKTNYSLKAAEMHYSKMKPRIICEKFMETVDGSLPVDYKFFCFNGIPKRILVTPERKTGVKRFMFDLNWNKIDFIKNSRVANSESYETVGKPKALVEMIDYAKKLAEPFPFVRIDFYEYEGKAVLGEMTFTPDAGLATRYKEDVLIDLGNMIKLPEKISY